MSKVRFELNLAGINELMKSPEMESHLAVAARKVADAAGEGYASDTHQADFTAIGTAFPNSAEAAKENYRENTLLKALSSVGLKMSK